MRFSRRIPFPHIVKAEEEIRVTQMFIVYFKETGGERAEGGGLA
jgi:hypothetical protein